MHKRYNSRRLKRNVLGYIVGYIATSLKPDNITIFDATDDMFLSIEELGILDRYNNPQFKVNGGQIVFDPIEPDPDDKILKDYESDYPIVRRLEMIEKGMKNPQDVEYIEYLTRKQEAENVARTRSAE